ncbi:MAG: PepSY-associated TM helix domain-containing protein [Bryobacteraceae bacterium]
MTVWQRWLCQPQQVWFRRALFQVHLWSGIGLGLYIFVISVTGSVLVYRNELYRWASAQPEGQNRIAFKVITALMSLHDDLFAGTTGRAVNGVGAMAVLVVALTGLVIWWPGSTRWRRSLMLTRGVGWKRFNWDLHSFTGFWSFAYVLIFGVSGIYLCYPERFQDFLDWMEPPTNENAGFRVVDTIGYWVAYLHFGRINGIGIPCKGPGVCDQTTKAVWAVFGLAPAVMFVTGALMWWNRVVRPRLGRGES